MVSTWRKTGKNWVKGTIVLNIRPRYKVNTIKDYVVDRYDFSKKGSLSQQIVSTKYFKTIELARLYVGKYIKDN